MKRYVFMVEFDWSTQDGNSDIEIQLYQNYSDASERFKELIANELNPDMSWAGAAFNKDGIAEDGYVFNCCIEEQGEKELWWYISKEGDYTQHSFIDLKKNRDIIGASL